MKPFREVSYIKFIPRNYLKIILSNFQLNLRTIVITISLKNNIKIIDLMPDFSVFNSGTTAILYFIFGGSPLEIFRLYEISILFFGFVTGMMTHRNDHIKKLF